MQFHAGAFAELCSKYLHLVNYIYLSNVFEKENYIYEAFYKTVLFTLVILL